MTVCPSAIRKLLQKIGPHQEINATVLESQIHCDFRLKSELIVLVPPSLFFRASLHSNIVLLIITYVVYSHHSSVDIHSESTGFSIPNESSGYKTYMPCDIYEKLNDDASKLKHTIGTKTINILIACSAEISTKIKISIEPGMD